jgi:hypothetical protein
LPFFGTMRSPQTDCEIAGSDTTEIVRGYQDQPVSPKWGRGKPAVPTPSRLTPRSADCRVICLAAAICNEKLACSLTWWHVRRHRPAAFHRIGCVFSGCSRSAANDSLDSIAGGFGIFRRGIFHFFRSIFDTKRRKKTEPGPFRRGPAHCYPSIRGALGGRTLGRSSRSRRGRRCRGSSPFRWSAARWLFLLAAAGRFGRGATARAARA